MLTFIKSRITVLILIVITIFGGLYSVDAEARRANIKTYTTKGYDYYGQLTHYYVNFTNYENKKYRCILTATNGAYYDFILYPRDHVSKRINDPRASYRLRCKRIG